MLLILSGRSFIKIQYTSFPLFPVAYPFRIATQLQYYVKREECKVNDVIFPSGCEAGAIKILSSCFVKHHVIYSVSIYMARFLDFASYEPLQSQRRIVGLLMEYTDQDQTEKSVNLHDKKSEKFH